MFKLVLLLLATLAASFVAAETAYFAFETYGDGEFVFKLTNDDRIAEARKILSGEETEKVHVLGRIVKTRQSYNPRYDFSFDPDTINFFYQAIEVCDASLMYVEDHLDEACGAFLPGCFFCPWSSKLTKEVKI